VFINFFLQLSNFLFMFKTLIVINKYILLAILVFTTQCKNLNKQLDTKTTYSSNPNEEIAEIFFLNCDTIKERNIFTGNNHVLVNGNKQNIKLISIKQVDDYHFDAVFSFLKSKKKRESKLKINNIMFKKYKNGFTFIQRPQFQHLEIGGDRLAFLHNSDFYSDSIDFINVNYYCQHTGLLSAEFQCTLYPIKNGLAKKFGYPNTLVLSKGSINIYINEFLQANH
jgi:hypothetical protein